MDYKEIYSKKKGKTYVFCNFEELLCEFYNVKTIEETYQYINGNDEYIIQCPLCKDEHTKHKLYIKADLSVGHCFLCNREYINVTDEVDISYNVPDFSCFWGQPKFELVKLTDKTWSLDRFKYEFDDFDEKGYKYLLGRHGFMKDIYKVLDFKFWEGNVVMPFKYRGEIFYYQIRFTGDSKIRYFFPPIKSPVQGAAKPPYIIEHGENKKFIICEGIYDAIACLIMAPEYTPMAVLGSSISDYQMEFLREYVPEEIKIFMDKTDLSIGIANRIKTRIDYCPISIIPSDGEDPEENMKRRLKWGKTLQWIRSKQNNLEDVNSQS